MFSVLYRTILDALFPLSPAEQELFSLSPEEALQKLTPAPDFSGLAVPLPSARSIFGYKDERVAKLVWNIKYKRSVQAVRVGGYALLKALEEQHRMSLSGHTICSAEHMVQSSKILYSKSSAGSLRETCDAVPRKLIIIPIPITTKRRRERGYNQCELLIDEMERLAKSAQKEPSGSDAQFIFEKNLLIRTQHVARQTLKGREDRLESAKGIFGIDEKVIEKMSTNGLKNYSVVIIDDVITTGSTIHEAIQTLKEAGFEDVWALSLAH